MSEAILKGIPGGTSEGIPDGISGIIHEKTRKKSLKISREKSIINPGRILERIAEGISEKILERISGETIKEIPGRIVVGNPEDSFQEILGESRKKFLRIQRGFMEEYLNEFQEKS